MISLSAAERELYSRQIAVPRWGPAAQHRLKRGVAFVAGAGGLGSAVCYYLTAAGIGCLRVCDREAVGLSNLNRQILYGTEDIGKPKAAAAAERLKRLNPHTRVVALYEVIAARSIERLAADASIVIDCLDNFETRFILNEYCVARSLPGSAVSTPLDWIFPPPLRRVIPAAALVGIGLLAGVAWQSLRGGGSVDPASPPPGVSAPPPQLAESPSGAEPAPALRASEDLMVSDDGFAEEIPVARDPWEAAEEENAGSPELGAEPVRTAVIPAPAAEPGAPLPE